MQRVSHPGRQGGGGWLWFCRRWQEGQGPGRRQGGGGVSFKEIQCMKVCVRKGVPLTEGYLFCPKLAVCSLRRGPPCFVITPWITPGNLTRVASPGSSQTSAQLCTYTPPGCHLLTWQVTHPLSTCLASFTKPGYMTPRPSMLSLETLGSQTPASPCPFVSDQTAAPTDTRAGAPLDVSQSPCPSSPAPRLRPSPHSSHSQTAEAGLLLAASARQRPWIPHSSWSVPPSHPGSDQPFCSLHSSFMTLSPCWVPAWKALSHLSGLKTPPQLTRASSRHPLLSHPFCTALRKN